MSAPTFEKAVARWRATRHPRFAVVAEAIAAREPPPAEVAPLRASGRAVDVAAWNAVEEARSWRDFARLFALVAAGKSALARERVEKLARWDDPRIVTALLGLLEAPPFTAGGSRKLWQAVVAALAATGDARAKDGMASLSLRYKDINDTELGAWLASAMSRAAAKMNDAPALTSEDAKTLDAYERALFGAPRVEEPPAAPTRRLDDLFQRIVDEPDDDDARLVYADALGERGDPRGEHIVLQVERGAGRGTPERSDLERALFGREQKGAWSGPLRVAARGVEFERGFPVAVELANTGLAQVAGAPEWGTVRRLTRVEHSPLKALVALLGGGHGKNLREIGVLAPRRLAKLTAAPLPFTHVTVEGDGLEPRHLALLPSLVHLEIAGDAALSRDLFAGAPLLSSLVLHARFGDDARALSPRLTRLALVQRSEPRRVAGLGLRELAVNATLRDAPAWLAAVPGLEALELDLDDTHWDLVRPLFDASPTLATLTLARRRGDLIFARDGTITASLGPRWSRFYGELAAAAPVLLGAGFARLVLYPEAPRHRGAPLADDVIAPLRAAFRGAVFVRDAL